MSIALKPIEERVIVQFKQEEEKKTAGGIILPDTTEKEKPQMAEVVAIGGGEKVAKEIKEGDTIIFGKYAGTEIEYEGNKYLILDFKEILAVIK